jgi:hypothetical protein
LTPKRYVLLEADGDATPEEWKDLARGLEKRFGKIKAIPIAGNGSALVIKTDNDFAPLIRECADLRAGERKVRTVLTSGSIGKLKRLASRSAA